MPRLPRLDAPGVAQHVIQRGNNRQICFGADEDFAAYAAWLREYASKYQVDIHAWVFMTNHVHLLLHLLLLPHRCDLQLQLHQCRIRCTPAAFPAFSFPSFAASASFAALFAPFAFADGFLLRNLLRIDINIVA